MPGINNISNVNNLDSKRLQSKLSFQVGEVFQGKVVESQGKDVVLKTTDGWQFTANVKIPFENLPKGLVKFKVVGNEDGKLQIEAAPEESEGDNASEKSIQTILKQQNLSTSKGNVEMLKSMVSHGLPLTKDNISSVKTIIDFKDKISSDEGEEDAFIDKYLQSKGIDQDSEQGKDINTLLKNFFSELKKASVEDLVTLKENGIDITADNLISFNKMFKEDISLYKEITQDMNKEAVIDKDVLLDNVNNKVEEHIKTDQPVSKGTQELKIMQTILENDIPITKENVLNAKAIIDLKEEILTQPKNEAEVIRKYLSSKNISEGSETAKALNNSIKEFFDTIKEEPVKVVLAKLETNSKIKTQEGSKNNFETQFKKDLPIFKEIIKDVLKGNELDKSIELSKNNVQGENIKTEIPQKADLTKDIQEHKITQAILENDIPVTKENISNIKTILELKEEILTQPKNENEVIKQYLNSKNISEGSETGKSLEASIKEFFEAIKQEPVKEALVRFQTNPEVKTEGGSIKTFEKQFKADLPVFKEIIKNVIRGNELTKGIELPENSAQGENIKDIPELKIIQTILENDTQITKENISNAKTIIDLKDKILNQPQKENEVIKQYLNVKNIAEDSESGKAIANNIKEFFSAIKEEPVKEVLAKFQPNVDEKSMETFEKQFKEDLPAFKEIINGILKSDELGKSMATPKENSLAESIKSEITQKTDFMKDIIKSMKDGDWSFVKNSINDIKVFNTVSNQYYYMDVPVNVNQRQYECKLFIKDDRKKGKKIDSKNVKMFVSVKTINMGKVDAYIKVSNRNVAINLKCKENFIKIFQNENNKLISTLQDMNYNVNLKVEKQGAEANIVTTREFFQDNAIGSINVMV